MIARQVGQALDRIDRYEPAIRAHAEARAAELSHDHDRVRAATRGEGARTEVSPVLPVDIIGPLGPRARGELMARRRAELGLDALTIEGGLLAPEQVARIAATERTARTAADYNVPKGLGLGDEIARYFRIGQAIWRDYARIDAPTVTQTATFARDLLAGSFGFDDLVGPVEHREGTRRFRIAWEAKEGRVPIVVASPSSDEKGRGIGFTRALPELGDGTEGRARRSPIVLLQDWLNHTDAALWGLVFAGDRVRLMRDNASLTRGGMDRGGPRRDFPRRDVRRLYRLVAADPRLTARRRERASIYFAVGAGA